MVAGMATFPWSIDEAQKRGFRVQQKDGLTLVTVSREKTRWVFDPDKPYANDSELVWRSALLNEKMETISLGFPKFGNHGEWGFESVDQRIERAISDGSALLTAKEDGTLIIRSVYNGEVIWRTRNSFDLGPFHDPVMGLVSQNEWLSQPDFGDDGSMLFEYVAPENQIVIRYENPMLILLGCRMGHRILNPHQVWTAFGIDIVRTMRMSARDPIGLQKEITELEQDGLWDCEGLVVRTTDGLMSKIKGSEYLNAFRMRYLFKYNDFAALCLANHVTDLSEAKAVCVANGVDWEALSCADEWFNAYSTRDASVADAAIWAQDNVKMWKTANPNGVRKDFATWVKSHARNQAEQTLAFVSYDDNPDKWRKTLAGLKDKAIFQPVTVGNHNPFFSLQEEA